MAENDDVTTAPSGPDPQSDVTNTEVDAESQPSDENALQELADTIEQKLLALGDTNGRLRRRLLALLQGSEKKNASKRLALRARKFAQQGGRCARCGQMFDRTRKLSSRIEEDLPLVCSPCERAEALAPSRPRAGDGRDG